jgi:uncharacterized protein (DUF2062 family)
VTLVARAKDVVVHRILGVDDTPHRIAWGVFLGSVVAWTPTIGLQIVLYVAVATLLRANKVSGVPILFFTNPVTAVPVYWFAWRVGCAALGRPADVAGLTSAPPDLGAASLAEIGQALFGMGAELWTGCLVLGVLTGVVGYAMTYWGVLAFRRARRRSR